MKYELTVTLRPVLYSLTAAQQFKSTGRLLEVILDKICGVRKYTCVAELTSENNIHYHCMLEIDDAIARDALMNAFRWKGVNNIFGRKTCNQVVYEDSYLRYMVKQTIATSSIIQDNPVICDHYDAMSHKYNIAKYFHDEADFIHKRK